jgi:hypothetical protein
MKQYLLITAMAILHLSAAAQKNNSKQVNYDMAIHFNSICCGPPDNTFLKKFLKGFNKANKVTVKAFLVGGCGREGEFKILLSYSALGKTTSAKLKTQLDALIPKQNAGNKAANGSSGNIELQYNPVPDDWQGCRTPLAVWKY